MGLFSFGKKTKNQKQKKRRPYCSAVIPAAGQAVRMGGEGKILAEIGGLPVLGHTILALQRCPAVDEIIIAARPEDIEQIADLCKKIGANKVSNIVKGGESRTHSVLNALMMCRAKAEVVAIHDGARPCVTPELCASVINAAARTGAAAPGVAVSDTLKSVKDGLITATVDRSSITAIQTPQCFEPNLIKGALTKALADGAALTDDCAAVERIGMSVTVVPGDSRNIKITTPGDLPLAASILQIK